MFLHSHVRRNCKDVQIAVVLGLAVADLSLVDLADSDMIALWEDSMLARTSACTIGAEKA